MEEYSTDSLGGVGVVAVVVLEGLSSSQILGLLLVPPYPSRLVLVAVAHLTGTVQEKQGRIRLFTHIQQ